MEVAHQFYDARVTDLLAAQGLLTKAVETGALPDWQQVPGSVLYTSLAAAVAVQLVVLSLFGKGRRLVLDTTETILAICLILVLLGIVIGLPLGIVYLSLKALSYLISLALGVPMIANVITSVSSSLGLRAAQGLQA